MATFARRTFDASAYLRYRATYSSSFISHILRYSRCPPGGTAIDLGCGPGQATILLAASHNFSNVTGLDPSSGMVDAAKVALTGDVGPLLGTAHYTSANDLQKNCSIDYHVGSAEELSHIQPESVDLIVAGQAAHWFDHDRVYQQLDRILKPGGTVAYWGYSYVFLPEHPDISLALQDFGLKTLAGYWEAGREHPEALYDSIPFPSAEDSAWNRDTFVRHKFDKTSSSAYFRLKEDNKDFPPTEHFPITMTKSMNLDMLRGNLKTWSSVHTYMESHKEEKHIVDTFLGQSAPLLPQTDYFKVCWPLGLMMFKKR